MPKHYIKGLEKQFGTKKRQTRQQQLNTIKASGRKRKGKTLSGPLQSKETAAARKARQRRQKAQAKRKP